MNCPIIIVPSNAMFSKGGMTYRTLGCGEGLSAVGGSRVFNSER